MGCGNCGTTTKDGKPSGCKSNGGCSTGGCNRKNVHNWLADIPLSDVLKPYNIIEVSFNNGSRKDFYKNNTVHFYEKGDYIAVEGTSGFDVGTVSLTGELVKLQMNKYGIKENSDDVKKILRLATSDDIAKMDESKSKEKDLLIRARAAIQYLKLDMKLTEVELQADGKKATFFYISEDRIDYRELIKVYANDFKVKVEMKQIGIRQEAAKVGGVGSCGRELCCSTWLTDFKTVSTLAARYQNLSINQTKLSGQCGRLKCCLNFELDTYMDALKGFPENAEKLETTSGIAFLQKKDIFKNLMWYGFAGSSKQYPLSIDRVNEIKELNKKGVKAEDLKPVELESKKAADLEKANYEDLVGQISLKSLEKAERNKRNGSKNKSSNHKQNAKPLGNAGVTPKPNNNNLQNKPNTNKPTGNAGVTPKTTNSENLNSNSTKPAGNKFKNNNKTKKPQSPTSNNNSTKTN